MATLARPERTAQISGLAGRPGDRNVICSHTCAQAVKCKSRHVFNM
jgi:hypothetical protein